MRYLLSILLFLPLLSFAQSTPSSSGFRCIGNGGFTGYGSTVTEAATEMCRNNGYSYQASRGGCVDGLGNLTNIPSCNSVAVCLTGDGYIAADSGGFCPDPEPEDEDGDGNDCDPGEEGTEDCQCDDGSTATPQDSCPENDRDDDGEPDSQDDDDGVCDNDNSTDGDCDGVCNAQDEGGSEDCEDGECPTGQIASFSPFDFAVFPFQAPSSICATNKCLYSDPSGTPLCTQSTSSNNYECTYSSTGDSCQTCNEPRCTDGACPAGTTRNTDTNTCEDIPNFCEIDANNDGIPDNQDTFACADNEPCTPDDPDCERPDTVVTYACQEQEPTCPADASAVDCAILQQGWKLRCSAEIEQDLTCEADFVCDLADPSLCAIAHTNYLSLCRYAVTQDELDSVERLLNPTSQLSRDVDSGAYFFGDKQSEGSTVNLSQVQLNRNTFQANANVESSFSGQTQFGAVSVDVGSSLGLWDILGSLAVLSSIIYALKVVNRAHTS